MPTRAYFKQISFGLLNDFNETEGKVWFQWKLTNVMKLDSKYLKHDQETHFKTKLMSWNFTKFCTYLKFV